MSKNVGATHSPEPWKVRKTDRGNDVGVVCELDGRTWAAGSWDIVAAGSDRCVAEAGYCTADTAYSDVPSRATAIANRDRIVACVNACAGLNPEAVPDLLAACRWFIDPPTLIGSDAEKVSKFDVIARAAIAKAEGAA